MKHRRNVSSCLLEILKFLSLNVEREFSVRLSLKLCIVVVLRGNTLSSGFEEISRTLLN